MKIRNGFVSNSSSQCFILDNRKDTVKELLTHLSANLPEGGDRSTAIAIGSDAVDYANNYTMYHSALSSWILKWSEKLGDNIVFLRESDEGIGGYLFGEECPDDWETEVAIPKEGVVCGWYDKNGTYPDEDASRRVFEVAEESMEYH